VPIGTARFDPPEGLAHATLERTVGYARVAPAAQALGRTFEVTQFWSPVNGDFADVAAARWEGARLALEDETGRELSVNNVVVLEAPLASGDGSLVRIVADFRPDLARVEAWRRTLGRDGGRTRPAA
jgi:hypothetical protein